MVRVPSAGSNAAITSSPHTTPSPGSGTVPIGARIGVVSDLSWLWLILSVALAVRCLGLEARSVWFDEALSWRYATHPVAEIVEFLKTDNSPPLYYVCLRCWMAAFGDTPVSLRLLSVGGGLAAVVGMYLFVRSLLSGRLVGTTRPSYRGEPKAAALITAFLVALSPLQIRYSWEVRMYALGTALAAFSSWALVRALDPGRPQWRRWLGYALLTLPFLYMHNFALLTLAAQALIVGAWLCQRAPGRRWSPWCQPAFWPACAAFGLLAVGFLPWVPMLLHQLLHNSESRFFIAPLTTDRQVYAVLYELLAEPWPSDSGAIGVTVAIEIVLLVTAWRGRPADWSILALGLAPIALTITACVCGVQVLLARYLVFSQPFLLASVGMAIVRLRPPALAAIATGMIVTGSFWAAADSWDRMGLDGRPGYRGAAEYLQAQRRPGEPAIVCSGFVYLPVHYHSTERSELYVYPKNAGKWIEGEIALTRNEILDTARAESWAGRRVWVVNFAGGTSSEGRAVPVPSNWREIARATFSEVFYLGDIEVVGYQVPACLTQQARRPEKP